MTTLAELKSMGAFVASEPVKREIEFKIGKERYTATVHVKKLSVAEQERMFERLAGKHGEVRRTAALISTLVSFGENGEETITPEEANSLHVQLGNALIEAINEINGQLEKN
jgi:hypothetical protein